MNEEEALIAKEMYAAIQYQTNNSERSLQAKQFQIGISDLGWSSERLRRQLNQQEPDREVDMLPAWLGTILGDGVEKAYKAVNPQIITQASVEVTLTGDTGTYTLPGHPDIIDPEKGRLLDVKTSFMLERARRDGPNQQQNFQRHLYGLGAWEAGHFGDLPLEEVKVGNVWLDRSGQERELHVQLEPFNMEVVEEAARWLDNVIYAFQNDEEAMKEPPRIVCEMTCPYFPSCRAYDTDVEGLIVKQEKLTAVGMYQEALDLERRAKKLKTEAKHALEGVSGSTGTHLVRWIHVNGSHVEFYRRDYERLDISKIK